MKKIFKSMLLFMAVTAGLGFLASCSDDDLPAADGLFRPVIDSDNISHGLDENNIRIQIAAVDGKAVTIQMNRQTVASVLPKGTVNF